eukprot:Platyproteum_vivax@DN4606_c0_g1_i2.p1
MFLTNKPPIPNLFLPQAIDWITTEASSLVAAGKGAVWYRTKTMYRLKHHHEQSFDLSYIHFFMMTKSLSSTDGRLAINQILPIQLDDIGYSSFFYKDLSCQLISLPTGLIFPHQWLKLVNEMVAKYDTDPPPDEQIFLSTCWPSRQKLQYSTRHTRRHGMIIRGMKGADRAVTLDLLRAVQDIKKTGTTLFNQILNQIFK